MNKHTFVYVILAAALAFGVFSDSLHAQDKVAENIRKASPEKPIAKPEKARKMLVFNRCCGYRHKAIPTGAKAMKILGEKTGAWEITESDDIGVFTAENLKKYDAVCLNNCTRLVNKMTKEQAEALKDYISAGGGLVGIHAATDNFYKYPELARIMGGLFAGHPWNEEVAVKVEEPDHPLCKPLDVKGFKVADEIYKFKAPYSRKRLRVLMSLDGDKMNIKKGGRKDNDYPLAWIRTYGDGRVFYFSLGHRHEIFWNPLVLKFYLAGVQYAMGDIEADATPSAELSGSGAEIARADKFVGEYVGEFKPADGKALAAAGQIFAEGDGKYKVLLLPGQKLKDGIKFGDSHKVIQLHGKVKKGEDEVNIAGGGWSGTLSSDSISAKSEDGKFELKYTVRKSPTLEAEPPKNATVLLPYKPGEKTSLDAWKNKKWKILPDGSVQVNKGNNLTKESFGSANIHIEFYIPYEPKKRGQGRGNSGAYVQGRYEVQVLDSFGLKPGKGDCGAIYSVSVPPVNACLPPARWQTYDIEFHAPKINNGKVVKHAMMTVRQNGITIHKNVKLPRPTTAAKFGNIAPTGPLMLQDHGHPVRYRNIWLVELED